MARWTCQSRSRFPTNQLDRVGQRVFRMLGLHPGVSFDTAAAAALGDVGLHLADEILDELVEVSLTERGRRRPLPAP